MSGRSDPSAASIAPLADPQLPALVDALARAFCGNPLNRAVVRSDDAERCYRSNRHGMRALLPVARARGRVLVATLEDRVAGGLVAAPPGGFPLPPAPPLDWLRCRIGQGWRVARRWDAVFEAFAALHPAEPHWYLGTLGVVAAARRRGLGRALMSRWLADVDRDRAAAYLETDGEQNVHFYEQAGFAPVCEARVLGVPIWCMRRPPAIRRGNN